MLRRRKPRQVAKSSLTKSLLNQQVCESAWGKRIEYVVLTKFSKKTISICRPTFSVCLREHY